MGALLRLKRVPTPVVVLHHCLTDAGSVQLAEGIRAFGLAAELQVIELPRNPALSLKGVEPIVDVVCMKESLVVELDLSRNPQFGDAVLTLLRPLLETNASKVHTLKLADCNLTLDAIRQFSRGIGTTKLRGLDLSCHNLSGGGQVLADICEAPVLEELTLVRCDLSADDIALLAEQLPYTGVHSLHLGGNGFGSSGLLSLAEHLPDMQIDELGLECNDIGPDALPALGTAWARRPFPQIRLQGNNFSQAELQKFIKTLRSIHG